MHSLFINFFYHRFSDFLDFHLDKEFEKSVRTKTVNESFIVVNDPAVKRRWVDKLFEKGIANPDDFLTIKQFFKAILSRGSCGFTMVDVQNIAEEKVLEEFRKKSEARKGKAEGLNHEMRSFLINIVKDSLISKSAAINIWHKFAQQFSENFFIVPNVVNFIQICVFLVKNVNETELITKLKNIKECLLPFLYFKQLIAHRSDIRKVVKYLDRLIKNPKPKIELQQDAAYPGIDERLKELVRRVLNDEQSFGTDFGLNKPKKDANFFMQHALLNPETAKQFCFTFMVIISGNLNKSESFTSAVISICERRFIKQHSELTRNEYSKTEILATNRFICELLVNKFITKQRGDALMKFIRNQKIKSDVSIGCLASLETVTFDSNSLELRKCDS